MTAEDIVKQIIGFIEVTGEKPRIGHIGAIAYDQVTNDRSFLRRSYEDRPGMFMIAGVEFIVHPQCPPDSVYLFSALDVKNESDSQPG